MHVDFDKYRSVPFHVLLLKCLYSYSLSMSPMSAKTAIMMTQAESSCCCLKVNFVQCVLMLFKLMQFSPLPPPSGLVTQLVEQQQFNVKVLGSIPSVAGFFLFACVGTLLAYPLRVYSVDFQYYVVNLAPFHYLSL